MLKVHAERSIDIDETRDPYPGWSDFDSLHGFEGDGGGCSGLGGADGW